jgi:hypothetical protein
MQQEQWYTVSEIHDEVVSLQVKRKDWGPVSMLIAFISVEKATKWLSLVYWASTADNTYKLRNKGELKSRVREILPSGYPLKEYSVTVSGRRKRVKIHSNHPELQLLV